MKLHHAQFGQYGDMDIVVANRDVMDTPTPKCFHGIRWYENLEFQFKPHLLTTLLAAAAVKLEISTGMATLMWSRRHCLADDEEVHRAGGYEG